MQQFNAARQFHVNLRRAAVFAGAMFLVLPLVAQDKTSATTYTRTATAGVAKSEVSAKKPEKPSSKWQIGVTVYGDYAYYTQTGFGPQFLTQTNQPGPGNGGFNSFDISRAYLNFFFTPTKDVTLRVTPNIYRQVDVSGAQSFGNGAAIGSSSNGNLGVRLKYAYVQFNTLFANSKHFGHDVVRVGSTTIPLIDWEEGLYGFRYVNLVPWNYLSLSSTYTGISLQGPIEWNGKEYLDYQIGIYNSTSFHNIEASHGKEPMARLTWYPMGTHKDRTGFGLTGFYDYGVSNVTPDSTKGTDLYRLAFIPFYQSPSKAYEIGFEYDQGKNSFGTGNLFSGSGPADHFGMGPTQYATFNALSAALLSGDHTRQQGFDVFGHAQLGQSPFTLFGMFQRFQPNTNISGINPLDLQRIVVGIEYKYNKYLRFALDEQNLNYYNSQFTMPASQIATFSPSLAAANPNGIADAVPQKTNAVMVNMEFNY